ncbi:MAG TPA: deoxyribonuclease IV [Candidatus Nitrosotenuis sp.]|nr:deoxyribonuclease IV [Candidatus Nitrosotenuis sp.]
MSPLRAPGAASGEGIGRGEGANGPLLGLHVSTAQGLHLAFPRARRVRAECLQIFTRAPFRWAAPPLSEEQVRLFRQAREEAGHPPVLAHDIYLTNLATPDPALARRSLAHLVEEIERCGRLGLDGLVIHPGAWVRGSEEEGLERLARNLGRVLRATERTGLPLLLEVSAGQGTCLGYRLGHLGQVIAANQDHPRLRVCLDTCHVFAAGYDLRHPEGYRRTWEEFSTLVGTERLAALHLNDSQGALGSRLDRHAHIGQGELGQEAFRRLLHDPRLAGLPTFLETPEMETMDRANMRRLRLLRRRPGPTPTSEA